MSRVARHFRAESYTSKGVSEEGQGHDGLVLLVLSCFAGSSFRFQLWHHQPECHAPENSSRS